MTGSLTYPAYTISEMTGSLTHPADIDAMTGAPSSNKIWKKNYNLSNPSHIKRIFEEGISSYYFDLTDPDDISHICSLECAPYAFHIGDVIYIPWTNNNESTPVTLQYPFVVADIADCEDDNGVIHKNALWLIANGSSPSNVKMIRDAENGSGKNYCYAWGQSVVRQWLNSDAAPEAGWWQAQYEDDPEPPSTYGNMAGWMNGFTSAWKAVFKPVKVVTTSCPITGNEAVEETTYDKFFLPSIAQLYGDPTAIAVDSSRLLLPDGTLEPAVSMTESDKCWPYFKNSSTSDVPTNVDNAVPARKALRNPYNVDPTSFGDYPLLMRESWQYHSTTRDYFILSLNMSSGDAFAKQTTLKAAGNYKAYNVTPACVIY